LLTPPVIAALPGGGKTRFQPIWVGDLVPMLADGALDADRGGDTYDIGGPEVLTLADVARLVRPSVLAVVPIPMTLAGVGLAVRATDPSAGEGAPLAYCHPLGATGVSRDESRYFPAFGRSVSRPRLTLHGRGADVRLGYLLSTEPYDEVAVEARASATGGTRAGAVLSLDGERVPLAPTESGE
jgi:hypothetical protein